MAQIRVRQAPSPTGKLHIGNVHTFLFNFAFARHQDGEVKLRIEDTDQVRSRPEYVEDIKEALTWLGLTWDGEIEFQSKRQTNYLKYAEQLVKSGDAYYCYHTSEELEAERKGQEAKGQAPRYSGACRHLSAEQIAKYKKEGRVPAVRFRATGENRPKEIIYRDLVYGEIKYNPEDFGDFVIVRSDKSILYNFGNVVDDHEMGITHVIRGQSHLTNTPRQILLYKALGWGVPEFGHLPDILNPDRVGKLSKRYGATAVSEFREKGYYPEAIINYLGSLSWSHPNDKQFFSLEEMVENFNFERVGKSPPAFDPEKLAVINFYYMKKNENNLKEKTIEWINNRGFNTDEKIVSQLVPMLKDRVKDFDDLDIFAGYFFREPEKPKFKFTDYNKVLSLAVGTVEKIQSWDKENIERSLREVQEKSGIGAKDFFVTIGQAISGSDVFLPLFDSLEILGQEETLKRLKRS